MGKVDKSATIKGKPSNLVDTEMLDQAVDAILEGMSRMIAESDERRKKEFDHQTREIKNSIRSVKDDIQGLKAELAMTPTKKEFNQLKDRVDQYHSSP